MHLFAFIMAIAVLLPGLEPIQEDPSIQVQLVSGAICQPELIEEEDDLLLPFVNVALDAGYTQIKREEAALRVSNGKREILINPEHPYLEITENDELHYVWIGEKPKVELDEYLIPADCLCSALGLSQSQSTEIRQIILSVNEDCAFPSYDEDALLWLSRAVWAEARGEELIGKIAVAQVILNRVSSPDYPGDVRSVIFQPYQFSTVSNGWIWNHPTEECILAARIALDGADVVGAECLFFNSNPGYTRGLTYIKTIGRHKFYAK